MPEERKNIWTDLGLSPSFLVLNVAALTSNTNQWTLARQAFGNLNELNGAMEKQELSFMGPATGTE